MELLDEALKYFNAYHTTGDQVPLALADNPTRSCDSFFASDTVMPQTLAESHTISELRNLPHYDDVDYTPPAPLSANTTTTPITQDEQPFGTFATTELFDAMNANITPLSDTCGTRLIVRTPSQYEMHKAMQKYLDHNAPLPLLPHGTSYGNSTKRSLNITWIAVEKQDVPDLPEAIRYKAMKNHHSFMCDIHNEFQQRFGESRRKEMDDATHNPNGEYNQMVGRPIAPQLQLAHEQQFKIWVTDEVTRHIANGQRWNETCDGLVTENKYRMITLNDDYIYSPIDTTNVSTSSCDDEPPMDQAHTTQEAHELVTDKPCRSYTPPPLAVAPSGCLQ